jgi:hypothetical protein
MEPILGLSQSLIQDIGHVHAEDSGVWLKVLVRRLKATNIDCFFPPKFCLQSNPKKDSLWMHALSDSLSWLKTECEQPFCQLSSISHSLCLFLNRVFEYVCLLRPSSDKIEWCDEVGQIDRGKKVEGWWTETMLKRLLFLSWTSLLKF